MKLCRFYFVQAQILKHFQNLILFVYTTKHEKLIMFVLLRFLFLLIFVLPKNFNIFDMNNKIYVMKQLFTLALFLVFTFLLSSNLSAQLQDGAEAPDWTLTDLDGNTHSLYDELNAGRQVYLVFSATWCAPCWSYHNSGHMETIYEDYGPDGTNEARVYFLEADLNTAEACLYGPSGCNGNTQGNWVDGIPFPIISLNSTNGPTVPSDYQIGYYPTVYTVCPDKRIFETGQASSQVLETYMTSCEMAPESIDPYDELCFEDETGGIDIEIIEGHGSTNFSWSNGSSSQNLSNVGQGLYTVTVTDANGVFIEMEGEVNGPAAPVALEEEVLELAQPCYGDNEGVIELSAQGGTPGYEALWADGSTGFTRTDLPVGNYSVEVTDLNGCSETASYEITEPPVLTLGLTRINENCDNADGVIIATSGGGTQPLQYDIGFGPQNNNSFTGLVADNYSLTVTDANGCEQLDEIEVENEPAPEAVAPAELEIACSGVELVIDASESEVQSGTDIEWSTSDGNILNGGNSLTPTVDEPGTYTLTLTNSSVCNDEIDVEITPSGDAPVADAGETGELDCNQTTVTIGSSNSSSGPDISYEWLDENDEVVGTSQFVDVEEVGMYTLIVSDTETGCASEASVEVIEVSSDLQIQTEASGEISCSVLEVELTGAGSSGGQNISYQWVDSDGNEVSTELTATVGSSGEYTLIITDGGTGCSTQESLVVDENTTEPDVDVEGESILGCDQEPVSLEVVTSASERSVVWYEVDNGDLVEIGTGDAVSISEAGEYQVQVTNNENGCDGTESFTVELDENIPTVEIASPANLHCSLTEITIEASGSSQGSEFSYQWTTPDGFIVSGANTLTPVVGSQGTYTLTIINEDNGCENSSTVNVEEYDEAPSAELQIATENRNLQFDADYQGVVNSYFWDFGDGNTSSESDGAHTYSENGTYDVCLTVTNECGENTFCQSIDIDVEALQASGAISNVNCHGGATGAIQLTVIGGVSPYTIEWSTGDEDVLELTGLSAGNYSAVITDADGEQQMVSFEITEPDALVVMDLSISNSSSGEDNGSITFDIDGGTPDYSFEWSNGATTQNLDDLAPGDYSLTVTDANGCVEAFGPFTVGVSSSSSNELVVNKFEIFPNPARDNVNIIVNLPGNVSPIELQIVDAQSRSLWTKVQAPTTLLRQQISISQLPSGTYFLKVESDGKQVVKPFIKK